MHPLLVCLLLQLFVLNRAAPLPHSESPMDLHLTNFSKLTRKPHSQLSLYLSTTGDTKVFHVPNTFITHVWVADSEKPIVYRLLRDIIYDAITKVAIDIKTFDDIVLPDDRDPYVDEKYGALGGVAVSMQSPSEGPAFGWKLTWGNVRDTLVGLREIMVKGGRPYKTTIEIWSDNLGLLAGEKWLPVRLRVGLGQEAWSRNDIDLVQFFANQVK